MNPFYIDECFCWLHPAASGRGAVLCSPIGLEDLVMHRFLRRLAGNLAAAGMPALRFDYRGTGDSAGSASDPGQVDAWLTGIRRAVQWLREEADVTQVVLIGFRLGALLAAEVAARIGDIAALVLIAPVISGKAWLREARALKALLARTAGARSLDDRAPDTDGRSLEVAGFRMGADTVHDVEQLDLRTLAVAPAPRILLLVRSASAAGERLAQCLRRLEANVTVQTVPALASMPWNSSLATLPLDVFGELVRWLNANPLPGRTRRLAPAAPRLTTDAWTEEPVSFGSERHLFGIHCRPSGSTTRSAALVMVNHGLNRHIGWARMYVSFARRLAALGVGSLRMDLSGVGDSAFATASPDEAGCTRVYTPRSLADIRAGLAWLRDQGYTHLTLLGHSSGAHLSFHAAAAEESLAGLVLINLTRFRQQPEDPVESAQHRPFRATGWYVSGLFDPRSWMRLTRGDVNVPGIVRAVAQRLWRRGAALVTQGLGLSTRASRERERVLGLFRQLSGRGTRILLLYSAEDSGLDELALYGGRGGRRIVGLPQVELRILPDVDHNLTPAWAREACLGLLERHLAMPRDPGAPCDASPGAAGSVSLGSG